MNANYLVVFTLAGQQLALPLAAVERIVRAVEVTPVPDAPPVVRGVINVQGRIVPVLDLRVWFGPLKPELDLDDKMIIAQTATGAVALVAEDLGGIVECGEDDAGAGLSALAGLDDAQAVVKHGDDLLLIARLDRLLTGDVERALRGAWKE